MAEKIITETINSFKIRWKTFLISFVLTFAMVALQQAEIKLPTIFKSLCVIGNCYS